MLANDLLQVIEAYIKHYGLTFDDAIEHIRRDVQHLKTDRYLNTPEVIRLKAMGGG